MLQELPWTENELKLEADKVESETFFWVGQLGTKEQINKVLSEKYVCRT